jgi:hypothetical protein
MLQEDFCRLVEDWIARARACAAAAVSMNAKTVAFVSATVRQTVLPHDAR